MYYIHSYDSNPNKIEIGFDCTNYQHQFREVLGGNAFAPESGRHVCQTIFLNDEEKRLWTWDAIDESTSCAGHDVYQWQEQNHAGAWTMVVSFPD